MAEGFQRHDALPRQELRELALDPDQVQIALDVGRTAFWRWDGDTRSLSGDRGLASLWGIPTGVPLTTAGFLSSLHAEDVERVEKAFREAAAPEGPEPLSLEFRILRRSDGAERWIALHGRRLGPDRISEGGPELVGMARDVTTRMQRESHLQLLMREVTHRSKNLLAIIQAMARQTVTDSLTAAEFEAKFSLRLKGLAISHDLLAARDWHGAPIGDLVRWHIGSALESAVGRVTTQGPQLFLRPEAAQNLGLAINELASNAVRFGALSGPAGQVAIDWSLEGTETRRLRINWRESGGPEVRPPSHRGFGHKVMDRLAARALDGKVDLSFPASGLQWSLSIPASFVIDPDSAPSWN